MRKSDRLKQKARKVARANGHDPLTFQRYWTAYTHPENKWVAYCRKCGRAAFVNTQPDFGPTGIYGDALDEKCP